MWILTNLWLCGLLICNGIVSTISCNFSHCFVLYMPRAHSHFLWIGWTVMLKWNINIEYPAQTCTKTWLENPRCSSIYSIIYVSILCAHVSLKAPRGNSWIIDSEPTCWAGVTGSSVSWNWICALSCLCSSQSEGWKLWLSSAPYESIGSIRCCGSR